MQILEVHRCTNCNKFRFDYPVCYKCLDKFKHKHHLSVKDWCWIKNPHLISQNHV